jgi:DNA-binding NtrC family response regulator
MRIAPVDVVLSDYEMSEVNGLDFLEHVRVAHPDIPFIPYTGRGSEAVASDAVARGVTEYVQKGFGRVHVAELATRILTTVDTTE